MGRGMSKHKGTSQEVGREGDSGPIIILAEQFFKVINCIFINQVIE